MTNTCRTLRRIADRGQHLCRGRIEGAVLRLPRMRIPPRTKQGGCAVDEALPRKKSVALITVSKAPKGDRMKMRNHNEPAGIETLIGADAVAAVLGVSKQTIRRWVQAGAMPAGIRCGRRTIDGEHRN